MSALAASAGQSAAESAPENAKGQPDAASPESVVPRGEGTDPAASGVTGTTPKEKVVKLKIKGKFFTGKLPVTLKSTTVLQLKQAIIAARIAAGTAESKEQSSPVVPDQLKCVVKGKILSDPAVTLKAAGVKSGSAVKVIKGASKSEQLKAAAASGGVVDEGPRERCKGGCGFWGSATMDGYCSTCFKKQSGVKEPPRWEHFDGGWVRFSKQVSSELERMRKMKKSKLSYGQGQHPQRIDLRALTMTPTRGPRQGRASKLRRVPPTHEGTFLTEEEWQEQKKAEDERKAAEDAEAEAKAKVESDMAAAMSKTRCCFAGCKKKLKLADTPCRCNLRFCRAHRLPENHNCTYNFKQRAVQNLCERADGGGRFDQLKTQSRDRL